MPTPTPAQPPFGYPSRDPKLDVLKGFQNPPPGYGEVAFFWWLGDPLTKERLLWQLEQLKGKGIMGMQINYAHSDRGGSSYGLTYPSDPPLFSEKWWELVKWFTKEAKKRGMAVSLSDYTLGFGQGWAVDDALRTYPQIAGCQLEHNTTQVASNRKFEFTLKPNTLCVRAFDKTGHSIDLLATKQGNQIDWVAPEGDWSVVVVGYEKKTPSIDPMNPLSGKAIIEKFFQPFEDRMPGETGKGLNFFFSDELGFGVSGYLWNDSFAQEFIKRNGYDIRPELALLFENGGPRTPKVRLDYKDVMVSLSEEGYFKPVFDWHQQRGMIYGCDHGGRGRDVTEFGDYFRTQKWNQGPGCDQPGLGRDTVKNKVASSIAHLYERPKVWLEGYYGSGWGTSSEDVVDATIANFLEGQNLLTFHGLYYSTHGGWWEWAPPENHWRMPYWAHMDSFYQMQQRLSYLLCQGVHVADVAILYPVAAVEAGMDGDESVRVAFKTCEQLYKHSIDLDFMDFESLDRSQKKGGRLKVAGESYRLLVLPSMKAIRYSSLTSALDFVRSGGVVMAIGALPEASDRLGSDDPEVSRIVNEIFGTKTTDAKVHVKEHANGGVGIVAPDVAQAIELISKTIPHDVQITKGSPSQFVHRKIGPREIYALYGVEEGSLATFRAIGKPEIWDPWTGQTRELSVTHQKDGFTSLRLPLSKSELQIVAFSPGKPKLESDLPDPHTKCLLVEGTWLCELKPTLDNQWGDFHWPPTKAFIGPETRFYRYHDDESRSERWIEPDFDDSSWETVTCGYGPKFKQYGPIKKQEATPELEKQLLDRSVQMAKPYSFSWQWGVEGDRGHQGYHGLKELVSSHFIRLGKKAISWPGNPWTEYLPEESGSTYYLSSSVVAPKTMKGRILVGGMKPQSIWLNGQLIDSSVTTVDLREGANQVLLRYDESGTAYFVIVDPEKWKAPYVPEETIGTLAMPWFGQAGVLPFDIHDEGKPRFGWFRFKTPPGAKTLRIPTTQPLECWVDGVKIDNRKQGEFTVVAILHPSKTESSVCLKLHQLPGEYAGSAITQPIQIECGEGELSIGDWSKTEGLRCYSGGMRYRKTIDLSSLVKWEKIFLDLGNVVASAEVKVNGKPIGIRLCAPWKWDITGAVKKGPNQIEILVYNTLANHYATIPTGYRGSPTSGILGPVQLIFESKAKDKTGDPAGH